MEKVSGYLTRFQCLIAENAFLLELLAGQSDLRQYVLLPRSPFSSRLRQLVIGRLYTVTGLHTPPEAIKSVYGTCCVRAASSATLIVPEDGFPLTEKHRPSDRYDLCHYQGVVSSVDSLTGECQLDGDISFCYHCCLSLFSPACPRATDCGGGAASGDGCGGVLCVGDTVVLADVHWKRSSRRLVACPLSRVYILNRRVDHYSTADSSSPISLCMHLLYQLSVPASGLDWFKHCYRVAEKVISSQCRVCQTDVLLLLARVVSLARPSYQIDEMAEFVSQPHRCTAMTQFDGPFLLQSAACVTNAPLGAASTAVSCSSQPPALPTGCRGSRELMLAEDASATVTATEAGPQCLTKGDDGAAEEADWARQWTGARWLLVWLEPGPDGLWRLLDPSGTAGSRTVLLCSATVRLMCQSQCLSSLSHPPPPPPGGSGSDVSGGSARGRGVDEGGGAAISQSEVREPADCWLVCVSDYRLLPATAAGDDVSLPPRPAPLTQLIYLPHAGVKISFRHTAPRPCSAVSRLRAESQTRLLVLGRTVITAPSGGNGGHYYLHVLVLCRPAAEGDYQVGGHEVSGRYVVLMQGADRCCWHSRLLTGSTVTVTVPHHLQNWTQKRLTTTPRAVLNRFPESAACRMPCEATLELQSSADERLSECDSVMSVSDVLACDERCVSGALIDVTGQLVTRCRLKHRGAQTRLLLCDRQHTRLQLTVFSGERVSTQTLEWLLPGAVLRLFGVRVSASAGSRAGGGGAPEQRHICLVLAEMSDIELVDWRTVDQTPDMWYVRLPHQFTSRAMAAACQTERWLSVASAVEVLSASLQLHCPLCDAVLQGGGACSYVGCHGDRLREHQCRCSARARVLTDDGSGCVLVHVSDALLLTLLATRGQQRQLRQRALAHGPLHYEMKSGGSSARGRVGGCSDALLSLLCTDSRLMRPLLWELKRLPLQFNSSLGSVYCEMLEEVTTDRLKLILGLE